MKRHRGEYDPKVDAGFVDGDLNRGSWLGQLSGLLTRLTPYKVDWKFSFVPTEDEVYEPGIDREVTSLEEANVISSEVSTWPKGCHLLAIDLDIPAYLVPSSTLGHHHLYVDKPIPHEKYMDLLRVLADCGIIEKGYAEVSIARGHSDLRLPWVSKRDQSLKDTSGEKAMQEAEAKKIAEGPAMADPFADFDF